MIINVYELLIMDYIFRNYLNKSFILLPNKKVVF